MISSIDALTHRSLRDSLSAIADEASRTESLQSILTIASIAAERIAAIDASSLMIADLLEGTLVVRASHRLPPEYGLGRTMQLGEGVPGEACRSGRAFQVKRLERAADPVCRRVATTCGLRSLLCVPAMADELLVGVVNLYTRTNRRFTEDQVAELTDITGKCAAVVLSCGLHCADSTQSRQAASPPWPRRR
ncbi:MAG: GAF domain-containing protein [Chitinivibrionales bacterium]|nr:GAF domain-containing protein [Chitinivibrionales bacterium]